MVWSSVSFPSQFTSSNLTINMKFWTTRFDQIRILIWKICAILPSKFKKSVFISASKMTFNWRLIWGWNPSVLWIYRWIFVDRLFTYQLLLSKVEILKLRCYSPIQLMAGLFVAAYRGNEIVNVMELSSYLFQSTTLILSVILTQNHLLSARKSCVMLGFVGFASAWNCQG